MFFYDLPFCRYKALKSPTLFLMTLRTQLADNFHHLVPNDNFHCQVPLKKTPNLTYLAEKNASWQIYLVANRDWLIVTVLHAFPAILSN